MDEQIEQIARALCKACGRNPDTILNGVPEWVCRQVEARAAHSVMAGTIAELTKLLADARRAIASLDVDALGWVEEPNARWPVREEMLHHIDAALAPPRHD